MPGGEVSGLAFRQLLHDAVARIEGAIAESDAAAGIAMFDADLEAEHVADPLFQRQRVGILDLASAARLLRLAFGHTLDMRERLGLAHIGPSLANALAGGGGIGHADRRARMAGGKLA